HSGTDEHAELARTLLAKVGLTETSLQCGTHSPYDRATARRLLERGEPLSPLRHNCSGKHAGMLLLSHCLGENLDQYLQRTDKVQREILQAFSAMVGVAEQEVELGIDGCSAPNFAVTLPASALGYARLMDPSGLDEKRAGACSQIVRAMLSNPEMVAGAGEFDTLLMQVMKGRLLSKGGAEGYQAIGIPTGQLAHGKAAGITLKVHDGDGSKRARSVVCLALLSTLGLLASEEREQLSAFDARPLLNFSQTEVGTLRLASESMARLHLAYERI
ncbi:MAG: asparaginase, partial [Anaerolineales bacterium]